MKALLAVLVPVAFFGSLGLSAWYAGDRLDALFRLNSRRLLEVGVCVGVVCALLAIGATAKSSNGVAGTLNVVGGYGFTFYLFLLLALVCLDAVQLKWSPPRVWSGTMVILAAAVVTGAGALWGDSFVVSEAAIALGGLKGEVTVMQISDVHLGHHRGRAYLEKIVEETNRRKPDLVLITGDLVDSNAALEAGVLDPLSQFAAPVYFVSGNHEKYVDTGRALSLIAQQGVRVLHNEVVETNGLQLVGLDYMNADAETFNMHPSDDRRTIQSVLSRLRLKRGLASVLMQHSPSGAQYAAAAGIGLMLSGHTHAGQFFPGTVFARWVFEFNRGLSRQGGTQVFVSQGAGTFMARVRIGTSNEINLLRLVPGDSAMGGGRR